MMTNIKELPDLTNSAKLLKISVELEGITTGGVIGLAIHRGLRKSNIKEVVRMLKSMYEDNSNLVLDILGEDLTKSILTVKI